MTREQGIVKWFDEEKNYGFITRVVKPSHLWLGCKTQNQALRFFERIA